MPLKRKISAVEQVSARRRPWRWLLAALLVALGYWKYGPPLLGPPSRVFSDPAAEKAYFHNGRDGIVLHLATQYDAYLEAEWEYTGFKETYKTLNVYRVFKGGWFRPTSRMLLYQYDGAAVTEEVLFYRKGQEVKLRLDKMGFDRTISNGL